MKKIDHLENRNSSVVTGRANLESLFKLESFPVFFGCVDFDNKEDRCADMVWKIDPDSGVIQLTRLIPLGILYQEQHVDGTGQTWQKYYEDFARYIADKSIRSEIFEIGGGAGRLAEIYTEANKTARWTLIEPNPINEGTTQIKVIKSFFDEKFIHDKKLKNIVFSQLMEHVYSPIKFLRAIHKNIAADGRLIFAYPNLKLWLERKYTNALNFEHTMFLTDPLVDYLLQKTGFEILDKTFYNDHSIFYTVKRLNMKQEPALPNHYSEYKKIFLDFVNYHRELVNRLNKKIDDFTGDIYLFGAHIFATYLFQFGLKEAKIKALLDDSKMKQGRRLYGTNLKVLAPSELKKVKNAAVILKVGIYRDEIMKKLRDINPDLLIWE